MVSAFERLEEGASAEITEAAVAEQFLKSVNSSKSQPHIGGFLRKIKNHSSPEFKKLYQELKSRK